MFDRTVGDGETVAIDIGTTAHAVAHALRSRSLVVVTNSVNVAVEFRGTPSRVLLLGGFLGTELCTVGGLPSPPRLGAAGLTTPEPRTSGGRDDVPDTMTGYDATRVRTPHEGRLLHFYTAVGRTEPRTMGGYTVNEHRGISVSDARPASANRSQAGDAAHG